MSAAGGNGALEEMTKEWGRELEEKVRDLTDGNKPLAYILGGSSLCSYAREMDPD